METLGDEWLIFVIIMSAFMLLFCLSALTKKACNAGCCFDGETNEERLERLGREQAHQIRMLQSELQRLQNCRSLMESDLPKYEEIFPDGVPDDKVVQIFVIHSERRQSQLGQHQRQVFHLQQPQLQQQQQLQPQPLLQQLQQPQAQQLLQQQQQQQQLQQPQQQHCCSHVQPPPAPVHQIRPDSENHV